MVGSDLSHRHLTIVLWRPGSPTQMLVACVAPAYYCGPMDWDDAHVRIARVPEDQRVPFKAEFELRDERAGVRLVGCDVHLIEEPAPHWRRALNVDEGGEADGAG